MIGERWTLLIVRDLVWSPKRFTELLGGLPGISTTLLSERLKSLEEHEIVRRAPSPGPGGGVRYELTPRGWGLAAAIAPLTQWGRTGLLDRKQDEELSRPEWLATMFLGTSRARAAKGVDDCYILRIEGHDVWIRIEHGGIRVGVGDPPREPDFVAETDVPTLVSIGRGEATMDQAVADGRVRLEGDREAARRAVDTLGLARFAGVIAV